MTIQKFDVTEHLRAKVRETLIGSLPDEQMDAMIQAEFRAYFEPERNAYNGQITPSPFQKLARETLSKEMETSLRRWLDTYFAAYWAEHGETALQDLVSGFVANAHQAMMENMIKERALAAGLQRVDKQIMKTPTEPTDRDGGRALLLAILIVGWASLIRLRFTTPDMTDARFVLTYWPCYIPLVAASILYVWLRQR